jgi:hypothetical protein
MTVSRSPIALAALTLISCAPKPTGGAVSADSHAPGTTLATTAAACGASPPGAAGVVRANCTGSAKVNVWINGVEHSLKGGDCAKPDGLFHLDLGVVAGPGLAGPKPDRFSLTTPVTQGPFTSARLVITVDGKAHHVSPNSGLITPTGGSFEGAADGQAIKGDFTC